MEISWKWHPIQQKIHWDRMPWKPKISKKLHFWPFFIVCSHFALLSALIITKMRSVEQYAHDRFFFAHTEIKESKRSSLFSQTRCYSLTRGRFLRETACNPVCRRIWRNPEWNPENLSGNGYVNLHWPKRSTGPHTWSFHLLDVFRVDLN